MNKEIVVATQNQGKAKEFSEMFTPLGFTVKTLLDFPSMEQVDETGTTFEENARLKADFFTKKLNSIVIADDSGLVVDALDGRPGVLSARYAGDHDDDANKAKVLEEMTGIPEESRKAHFKTVLVAASPNPLKKDLVVEGEVNGIIAPSPRGNNGFGYDDIFYVPEIAKTFGEVDPEIKESMSHRGKAVQKLFGRFDTWLKN